MKKLKTSQMKRIQAGEGLSDRRRVHDLHGHPHALRRGRGDHFRRHD